MVSFFLFGLVLTISRSRVLVAIFCAFDWDTSWVLAYSFGEHTRLATAQILHLIWAHRYDDHTWFRCFVVWGSQVENLRYVVEQTDAKIVLSTDWRRTVPSAHWIVIISLSVRRIWCWLYFFLKASQQTRNSVEPGHTKLLPFKIPKEPCNCIFIDFVLAEDDWEQKARSRNPCKPLALPVSWFVLAFFFRWSFLPWGSFCLVVWWTASRASGSAPHLAGPWRDGLYRVRGERQESCEYLFSYSS